MPYPYPSPNASDMAGIFAYANTVSDGVFWPLMLGIIYVIVFITLSLRSRTSDALAASGFFTGIVGVLMFVLTLVNEVVLIVSIMLAIAGFVMLLFTER